MSQTKNPYKPSNILEKLRILFSERQDNLELAIFNNVRAAIALSFSKVTVN